MDFSLLNIAEIVTEYFKDEKTLKASDENCNKRILGYKCVLNSKATEESMVCLRFIINSFQLYHNYTNSI